MSLLLCSALVGIRLRNANVLLSVLFVYLSRQSSLAIQRSHLLVNVFAVVIRHLHSAVKVVKGAVRHF